MDKHWQKPENQRQRNFWREDQLDFYFIPAFIQVSPFLDTLRTNRLNSYAVTLHVLLFAVIWMYSNFSGVPEKSTVCHLFGDGIFIACIRDFLCNILNTSGTFCVIHQSRANWFKVQIYIQMSSFLKIPEHLLFLLVWLIREKTPNHDIWRWLPHFSSWLAA